MNASSVRVIAICLFTHEGRILVSEAFDSVKQSPYYRPLGGGVEYGERAADALRREIVEELEMEIDEPTPVGVIENIFTYEGAPGHEIVFVFDARFIDASVYDRTTLIARESDGNPSTCRWLGLDFFNDHHRLVPEELRDLLRTMG